MANLRLWVFESTWQSAVVRAAMLLGTAIFAPASPPLAFHAKERASQGDA